MTKYILGIDIGGTKITGILFDGKQPFKELTIITPKTKKDFVYSLRRIAAFLSAGSKISHIGIGVAGLVDPKKNIVVHSPNISYLKNFNFKEIFGKHAVIVDNDANCFARAEWLVGQGKGKKNVVGLILGTGVGAGFVIDGKLYRGSGYAAGEIGHTVVNVHPGKTLEDIFKVAKHAKGMREMSAVVGVTLVNIANTLNPEIIVLGGGMSAFHSKEFLPGALKVMKPLLFDGKNIPKVVVSKLKNAGAIGAALQFK